MLDIPARYKRLTYVTRSASSWQGYCWARRLRIRRQVLEPPAMPYFGLVPAASGLDPCPANHYIRLEGLRKGEVLPGHRVGPGSGVNHAP